jgi:hypothetical protein
MPQTLPLPAWILVVAAALVLNVVPVRCAHPISQPPFRGCRVFVHGLLGRCRHHGRHPGTRVITVLGGPALGQRRTCSKCGRPSVFGRFPDTGRPFLGCAGHPTCKNPRQLGTYRL